MDSTPPDDAKAANIHDLAKAGERHSDAIDAALRMLDRIERRDQQAAERHRELCDAVQANTRSLEQFGELVHESNRKVKDHEARIGAVEEHLLQRTNGHG